MFPGSYFWKIDWLKPCPCMEPMWWKEAGSGELWIQEMSSERYTDETAKVFPDVRRYKPRYKTLCVCGGGDTLILSAYLGLHCLYTPPPHLKSQARPSNKQNGPR